MKIRVALCTVLTLLAVARANADLAEVRKRTQLRVLVADTPLAFFAWPPATPPGLEREILQGFARLHEVRVAFVRMESRAALLSALAGGEGDVAAGGLCALEASDVAYSAEVLPSRYVVVSRRPAQTVLTLDELRQHRLAIARGRGMAEALAAAGATGANVDESLDSAALLPALKAGRISACVLRVEEAIPAQRADPELQLGMYVGGKLSLAFALRKGDEQLRSALSEYVRNVRRSAAWNRLVVSYFGASAADILKASR